MSWIASCRYQEALTKVEEMHRYRNEPQYADETNVQKHTSQLLWSSLFCIPIEAQLLQWSRWAWAPSVFSSVSHEHTTACLKVEPAEKTHHLHLSLLLTVTCPFYSSFYRRIFRIINPIFKCLNGSGRHLHLWPLAYQLCIQTPTNDCTLPASEVWIDFIFFSGPIF